MEDRKKQFYFRAELSADGRALVAQHQQHLAEAFRRLRVNPRLTPLADVHWTALFLGSAERWNAALRTLGSRARVSPEDILRWADVPERHAPPPPCAPETYDVFYKGETNAVFVLHLRATNVIADAVLERMRAGLAGWEREGRLPQGAGQRLFRVPSFPLARAVRDPKPHLTLARGRVSRERQRDVYRSLRALALPARDVITFGRTDIRVVRDGGRNRDTISA